MSRQLYAEQQPNCSPSFGVFVILRPYVSWYFLYILLFRHLVLANMSYDEKTALLATERGHQQHISIVVLPPLNKDPKDYEPIFTTADYSYGLSLEELLPFTLDPWWQNVRRLCFGCLWLAFMLTLLTAISLAYFHDASAVCRANASTTTTTNLPTSTSPPSALALMANGTKLLWASL